MVDPRLSAVRVEGQRPNLAGADAGAGLLDDGGVGAGLCAAPALHALRLIDLGVAVDDGDRALGTGVQAAVGDAAPAGLGHQDALHRALVAGNGQHLHHALIRRAASQRQLHPLADDGALLVDAAAQQGLALGNDPLRDGEHILRRQRVRKGEGRHLLQHLVLQFLNIRIEYGHRGASFAFGMAGGMRRPLRFATKFEICFSERITLAKCVCMQRSKKTEPMGFFVHRFWCCAVASGNLTATLWDTGKEKTCASQGKPEHQGLPNHRCARNVCLSAAHRPGTYHSLVRRMRYV